MAIISANAYERGLNNDDSALGIGEHDFILKPVQMASCSTGWASASA
ncbi:MAG: hypothetical protein IPJ73_11840 [Zoogloea sp.]|nr:hypothetical protein [Zoogloea sp.]